MCLALPGAWLIASPVPALHPGHRCSLGLAKAKQACMCVRTHTHTNACASIRHLQNLARATQVHEYKQTPAPWPNVLRCTTHMCPAGMCSQILPASYA